MAVSMETSHDLLDLVCLYCDKDPEQEEGPQVVEEPVSHNRWKVTENMSEVTFLFYEGGNGRGGERKKREDEARFSEDFVERKQQR